MMQQEEPNKYVKELTQEKYKYGFTTEVHTDIIEKGLNEDVIRLISSKKEEPEHKELFAFYEQSLF
jgi:Fe-S cluster assembly protein SufB